MAEERILTQKIEPECKFRELHETTAGGHYWVDYMCGKVKKWTTCEEDDFIHCEKKELIGLSRQEAIERMAKAICASWLKGGCKACKHKEKSCKEYVKKNMRIAEAALDALLEEK